MARAAAHGGTQATPRGLKIVQGNPGHRPIEPEVPFTRGLPIKPDDLSEDAAWMWDLVISQMQGIGLLKPIDAPALEVICETFARWREAVRFRKERGQLGKNSQGVVVAPWVKAEGEAAREFRAWCAEFGFTPAAESNVAGAEGSGGGGDNPFG